MRRRQENASGKKGTSGNKIHGKDINDGGQYRCCAEFAGISGAASERTLTKTSGSEVTESPGYSPLRG
jgi:hypothetical protein